MNKNVAVITGATSGIGLETARALAHEGFKVVMACRDIEKASSLAKEISKQSGNEGVNVIPVNMASMHSIREFASLFAARYNKLHVLINNAGVFCDRQQKTEDGFELTMGVNYLGPFLLTRLLLPIIKDTPGARIINVISKAAFYAKLKLDENTFTGNTHGFKAYSASKLAQILFTIDLAEELKGHGVTVNAAYPGRVATNIWRGDSLMMRIAAPLMMRRSVSAEEGAKTVIYLAVSPAVEGITGKMYYEEDVLEYKENCLDARLREKLMELSFKAIRDT